MQRATTSRERPWAGSSPTCMPSAATWRLAITLGLVCGAAAAVAAWFVATERYTANALLQVSANETTIVFNHNGESSSSFEVFKGTQQQMLTSDVRAGCGPPQAGGGEPGRGQKGGRSGALAGTQPAR